MNRFSKRMCGLLLLCSGALLFVNAAEGGGASGEKASWAVGYDEGLSFKMNITDKIAGQASIGYNVVGADTLRQVPVNQFLFKIGGAYLLKDFSKLRVNAFLDLVGIMNQDQLAYTTSDAYNKRYNRFDFAVRTGLAPEIFITDNISLTYKFGLQYIYYGSRYQLNTLETDTQSSKTGHSEFGVYGAGSGPFQLLHNIGLMIYF
ncbi:MAG: hypothetical protein PHC61_05285 [Chitinivibrionales bacterium]|nr:hypothetical protein [Chitinivibrionales bacterium]